MADQFLHSILRQVAVKDVDWNAVATECDIPTANAARVRFTRLKAKLENQLGDSPVRPAKTQSPGKRKNVSEDKDKDGAAVADKHVSKRARAGEGAVKVEDSDECEDTDAGKQFVKKGTAKRVPAGQKQTARKPAGGANSAFARGRSVIDVDADSPSGQLLADNEASEEVQEDELAI